MHRQGLNHQKPPLFRVVGVHKIQAKMSIEPAGRKAATDPSPWTPALETSIKFGRFGLQQTRATPAKIA
jgi:hypothetical protein